MAAPHKFECINSLVFNSYPEIYGSVKMERTDTSHHRQARMLGTVVSQDSHPRELLFRNTLHLGARRWGERAATLDRGARNHEPDGGFTLGVLLLLFDGWELVITATIGPPRPGVTSCEWAPWPCWPEFVRRMWGWC